MLASEEAARLGYPWVTTDHILLGLLSEGSGIASRTLQSQGLSLDEMRDLVVRRVPGAAEAQPSEMTPPLAPQAVRLLGERATAAAAALGHNYVGTEHLLLALCAESESPVLVAAGITGDATRARVLELMTTPSSG